MLSTCAPGHTLESEARRHEGILPSFLSTSEPSTCRPGTENLVVGALIEHVLDQRSVGAFRALVLAQLRAAVEAAVCHAFLVAVNVAERELAEEVARRRERGGGEALGALGEKSGVRGGGARYGEGGVQGARHEADVVNHVHVVML